MFDSPFYALFLVAIITFSCFMTAAREALDKRDPEYAVIAVLYLVGSMTLFWGLEMAHEANPALSALF